MNMRRIPVISTKDTLLLAIMVLSLLVWMAGTYYLTRGGFEEVIGGTIKEVQGDKIEPFNGRI